jgi:hypothetical protein
MLLNLLYMLIGAQFPSSRVDSATATVRIPNAEIQSEFRKWIQEDFRGRMTQDLYGSSVALFHTMVDGKFSEFAKTFGEFVLTMIPQRIFGSVETVYQEYLYAYFSSAADAIMVKPTWTTMMEIVAGDGRSDMIFYQNESGIIIEVKRLPHTKKEGYRDVGRVLLSHEPKKALQQCDTRHYRAIMPEGVTTICEYGLAFLGPYCGVEARIVERVGGKWVTGVEYTAEEDEERRKDIYCR